MITDRTQLQAMVDAHRWQFAKTMPNDPHEYSMKRWGWSDVEFHAFCHATKELGVLEQYRHFPPERYFYMNGWRYWCGNPDTSINLNRSRADVNKHLIRRIE